MKYPDLTKRHLFSNKMYVDLDVLGSSVLNRIGGHVNSTDIVAKNDSSNLQGVVKLAKKLTKPTSFSHCMSHCTILCLSIGARNRSLSLRGPGNEVITEIHTVTERGAAGVRATNPIGVGVSSERCGR
jgi:hypothetical protein